LAFLGVPGCARDQSAASIGDTFPSFNLPALDGIRHSLSEFVGKPLLVNLWATWCAPCRAEMADLDTLYESADDGAPAIVTISVDEDLNMVREIVRSLRFSCPVLVDAGQRWAREALRAQVLPMTYLLDRNAIICEVFIGPRPWASSAMRAEIAKRLG